MTTQQDTLIGLSQAQRPVTVGEMVVADYRKAEVFRKYGIDYCCGGKKPLEAVCQQKGLDPNPIQKELDELDQLPVEPLQDFNHWELDKLADYVIQKHHQYVTDSVPMLYELTTKVARVHGDRHPELLPIARYFEQVAQELQRHMLKEERVLFPHISQMATAIRMGMALPNAPFGSIENPIQMMESEHESAGGGMEEIRQLSDDYTPPEDACTSYRVLYAKLQEFEQDLHQHVHLESNILFPKAIQLEKGQIA